ncbi:hypothetical protein [Bradyrhizobium sp. JYMT SZCCT0428]|uniref:hypothetical protein n=1 Tax=Bradyrhizobium sp. JYMT SZCCT0428 TaxID=2807673 RepID=UPI002010E087|nr:hypothetical protein [Bradyrhizobium sp. JYMT SZCCT0428]
MGTFPKMDGRAPIHVFASSKSWIEGNATLQLEQSLAWLGSGRSPPCRICIPANMVP